MSIISRYLTGEYLKILGLSSGGIFVIFLVVDFFEKMRRYARFDPSPEIMLTYFLLRIPQILLDIIPLALLMSAVLTLGMLSRRNEIIAMKGTGIGSVAIMAPFLGVSFLVCGALLMLNVSILPFLNKETEYIKNFQIRKKPPSVFFRQSRIWLQPDADTFMNVQLADSKVSTLYGLNLYRLNEDFSLAESIVAEKAQYRGGQWFLSEGFRKTILPDGRIQVEPLKDFPLALDRHPQDFVEIEKDTKRMTYQELESYVSKLDRHSLPTHRYRVDLYSKIFFPFTGFAFVMVGVPLVLRQGLKHGVSRAVGITLVMAIVYWVVFSLSMTLGYGEVLPAMISAGLPTLAFISTGFILMKKAD